MPESTELKPSKLPAVFVPQPMGILVLLVIVLAFVSGALRQDLALVLTGAAFLLPWIYCLFMTLLLALVHTRRTRRAFIRVSPREVTAGNLAEAIYSEPLPRGIILQLPGILVRCRLLLETGDGRRIQHDFNPALSTPHSFAVNGRGAYFSVRDEFAVFDILGFFRFARRLPIETGVRLLASPSPADESVSINARAGESNLSPEFSFQRTDNFIDHRPYVPGDDPRRINWKLYGHGGWLFVREGEREPPPHSHIIILIDTEYDPRLYNAQAARHGIDMLCKHALAAALACKESGVDVLIGYSGGPVREANPAALAWPAALPLAGLPLAGLPLSGSTTPAALLPKVADDRGILIFALPRSTKETGALDHFLIDTASHSAGNNTRLMELLFFCAPDNRRTSGAIASVAQSPHMEFARFTAAELCVALYNQRPGVRARAVRT